MKKDKDADKTDTMDVIILFNSVQGTHETKERTVNQNEKLQKSIPLRYSSILSQSSKSPTTPCITNFISLTSSLNSMTTICPLAIQNKLKI